MATALATHAARANRKLRFKLVLTSSEELPAQARAKIANAFDARIIDYYGQAERVAFAWSEAPGEYYFHPGYGRVELQRTETGAPEIIGTCFHNRAQFLLRYRTGDQIVLGANDDLGAIARGEASFQGVSGRASDVVYGPAGEVFLGLNHIPRPFDQIEGLQIVQTGPGEVLINVRSEHDHSDTLRDQIMSAARQKIGPSVKLEVAYVDAFRKSTAGKTPFVIHDWKPST
jgi:phenylacetate-CoA ligase